MVMALRAMFVCVFLSMVAVTFAASLDRNIWAAAVELWPDLWFRAVLLDAYFGFFGFGSLIEKFVLVADASGSFY